MKTFNLLHISLQIIVKFNKLLLLKKLRQNFHDAPYHDFTLKKRNIRQITQSFFKEPPQDSISKREISISPNAKILSQFH
ncbi:hypothetical protein THIOM_004829 [Candidatus Thiomargarita nelsonii]|uniref:Uncharacterized protein n=1 Tax=Candidatus Thiomargarita nelsonii TaxID=1003181 RepID=A0A176RUV4_9GAMM|nr:hypothetical protein THIOM_004829 [Candidatus Thiomargarita nelsonii]